jgi:hypothetical protein
MLDTLWHESECQYLVHSLHIWCWKFPLNPLVILFLQFCQKIVGHTSVPHLLLLIVICSSRDSHNNKCDWVSSLPSLLQTGQNSSHYSYLEIVTAQPQPQPNSTSTRVGVISWSTPHRTTSSTFKPLPD